MFAVEGWAVMGEWFEGAFKAMFVYGIIIGLIASACVLGVGAVVLWLFHHLLWA